MIKVFDTWVYAKAYADEIGGWQVPHPTETNKWAVATLYNGYLVGYVEDKGDDDAHSD